MRLRVVFRRAAQVELEEAVAWCEGRRRGLGEEFFSEISDAIEKAAARPEAHPAVHADVLRTVCRRFPFSICFRIRGGLLVVLAVFHGRRDPVVWMQRS